MAENYFKKIFFGEFEQCGDETLQDNIVFVVLKEYISLSLLTVGDLLLKCSLADQNRGNLVSSKRRFFCASYYY